MEDKIILKKVNESYVRIITNTSILLELRDKFSFMVDGYRFSPKYKYGSWDGKICMIQRDLIPLGLVDAVKAVADNFQYDIEIDEELQINPYFTKDEFFEDWLNDHPVYDKQTEIKPYWYQADAVRYGIDHKRCILNLPTSAGKSLIQGLLAKWFTEISDKNILLLVPTIALTDQMENDLVNYRLFNYEDINIVRGGSKDVEGARITVGTWQSICKRGPEFMSQFGMLLVDEVHLATGTTISNIIKCLTDCEYKIGLSGSLKDGKANSMSYVGLFGSVFAPVTTRQLADEGFVSDLDIKMLFLQHDNDTSKLMKGKTYADEVKYITHSAPRMKMLTSLANVLAKKNENVLILFKHIDHGKRIYDHLVKLHGEENVMFISGETKREDRTSISRTTEDADGRIIVASYGTTSTGISIKKLHHVILAHPVKSKIIVIQSIGRLLRKHKTKEKAQIWDLVDSFVIKQKNGKKAKYRNYALKHGGERLQMYINAKFDYSTREINL